MNTASPADGEAMPRIPPSNIHTGNEAIDELDFAMDLLRVARVALQSPDMGSISEKDITAAGNCVAYALDALRAIRAAVDGLEGRPRT